LMPGEINRLMLDDPPGDLGDVFLATEKARHFRYGRNGVFGICESHDFGPPGTGNWM